MSDLISDKQKIKLRRMLKELGDHRARHTELISVYIPIGYDHIKVIQQLQQEAGTAENIKSKATRKNVQAALERMIQHLRLYKKTPANGLAAFSGNVAEREGAIDVKVWSIEPPIGLKMRMYKCDQRFFLEPLQDMLRPTRAYGLIVMDRRESNVALLKGKAIILLQSLKSMVPGKIRAGGQSAARFARVTENLAKDFYQKVGTAANTHFREIIELQGIIIGGPGHSKEEFANGSFLDTELKKKIIGLKDLSYTGEFGLNELVDKSEDLLEKEEIMREKKIMMHFFDLLGGSPHLIAYGEKEVINALKTGAVDTLLVSESVPEDKVEELADLAEDSGSKFVVISTDTREGVQLESMGGFGAILRFSIG